MRKVDFDEFQRALSASGVEVHSGDDLIVDLVDADQREDFFTSLVGYFAEHYPAVAQLTADWVDIVRTAFGNMIEPTAHAFFERTFAGLCSPE